MSLKAKIEAVIYAAEEPVTLAQIVGLLGGEAQTELDRLAAAQQSLALEELSEPSEPNLLSDEVLAPGDATIQDQVDEDQVDESAEPLPQLPAEEASRQQPATVSDTPPPPSDPRQERERARAVRELLRSLVDDLVRDYATPEKGLELREVAGGFRLATKPEYHDAVRGFVKTLKPPLKLSLQALETLAVVAYKQPVTAPEISEIRGVDSGGVLGSLMARKLVTTAGRKQVIGRPILYKTTKDFLLRFGLKDVGELPSIEEFEKMASELAEGEPRQEEIHMDQYASAESPHSDPELARRNGGVGGSITGANLEEEKDATEPQADGDSDALDQVTPDGRLSGIPSTPSASADNPSAAEADIQQREGSNGSQE